MNFAETKDVNTLRAHQIKTTFFTPEILAVICQGLVGHYFLLTSEDLQMWDEDPETFGNFLFAMSLTFELTLTYLPRMMFAYF